MPGYLGLVTQLGLVIVFSVILGAVVGLYLDNFFGTKFLTIVFILLGSFSGLYSVFKTLIKISMDDLDK